MSNTIYLFKEHADFQVGKSRLNKAAVFETNIVMISIFLFGTIALFALAGGSLRWQWRFAFLHGQDWFQSVFLGLAGLVGLAFVFFLMMTNRKERYKYAMLEKYADRLISARVERVGVVEENYGLPGGRQRKERYHYANYVFTSPDMGLIKGQLRSGKPYDWPRQIQRNDTLMILYLDSETYCVL